MTTPTEYAANGKVLSDQDRGRELIAHKGIVYLDYLADLVRTKGARNYLEIGTFSGSSLARINVPSIAVDPKFSVDQNIMGEKPFCMMFQLPSDSFFEHYSPAALFGTTVDVAFLDGMHLYEYLLRDFMNCEKSCASNSLIVMHDCVPPTFEMAGRAFRGATLNPRYLNYWTGDVWKILPILKKYRPDLRIAIVDCPPTGLAIVGNLDPSSTVLKDRYSEIVQEFENKGHDFSILKEFLLSLPLTSSKSYPDAKSIEALLAG
jgi:hypothetical protein